MFVELGLLSSIRNEVAVNLSFSRSEPSLREILGSSEPLFPLSSIRHSNFSYFSSRYGEEYSNESFVGFLDKEPICVAIRTTSSHGLSFFDEPFRIEFSACASGALDSAILDEISREAVFASNGHDEVNLEFQVFGEEARHLL